MVDLTKITTHSKKTYIFLPPSVAHQIGFALNANKITDWELHSAHSAKQKGLLPEGMKIPKVLLHENEPEGKIVLRKREWVLISYLDTNELKEKFEELLSDEDIINAYLAACGQENLDAY